MLYKTYYEKIWYTKDAYWLKESKGMNSIKKNWKKNLQFFFPIPYASLSLLWGGGSGWNISGTLDWGGG